MGGSEKYFIRDTDVKKWKDSAQFEVYEVLYCSSDTTLTCSCKWYELYGLLCRHILYVLRMNNVKEFPREFVLDRWSKSDDNLWLDLYRLEFSDLMAQAEKADVPVLMRVNKKDTFCSMLGVTDPE
ncbi:FAR1 DNA binding domain, zinc finger, SWIM-type, MULE transposase domain containing protein, partial [Tanacetum coccineum]